MCYNQANSCQLLRSWRENLPKAFLLQRSYPPTPNYHFQIKWTLWVQPTFCPFWGWNLWHLNMFLTLKYVSHTLALEMVISRAKSKEKGEGKYLASISASMEGHTELHSWSTMCHWVQVVDLIWPYIDFCQGAGVTCVQGSVRFSLIRNNLFNQLVW